MRQWLRRGGKDRETGVVPGQQERWLKVKGAMEREFEWHCCVSSDHIQLLGTGLERAEGGVQPGLVFVEWVTLWEQVPLPFL